ncbi:MAG: DNA polymerase III subunit delta' [Thermodesulfovibrionales bacterium]|nr:DNA polymerase III subunit delta' [Thermodesulfovibrionales bacterium]
MAFRDIIGQKTPVRILKGLLRSGRLPHAFLFTGEPGIGKLFTAKTFLKTLICKKRDEDFNCCDSCRSCRSIDTFSFPDLRLIKPENGQIKIETIRELNEFLNMSPYDSPFKMVLIDEADRINISAANAFLKTLEEPPRDAIIILITEKPEALADTIRSRCVRIPFSPLSINETIEVMKTQRSFPELQSLDSDLRFLYEGRPGILFDDQFKGYIKLFKRLLEELEGVPSEGKKQENLTREDMTQAIEIVLLYLRNRLVELVTKGSNLTLRAADIQGIIERYRKVLSIRELIQFNLNVKITWNYIKRVLNQ